jgi:serine/threonine-protein phosphatase 2B regulatory subunit
MGGAINKIVTNIKEDFLNQETEIEAVQFEIDESLSGQGAQARATFERLGLSNGTVNQLYGAYCAIDSDGGGSISDTEFYTFFRLDQSKFTDRAFFLFDKDGTGEIDFEEFVLAVWNFCTIEGGDLVRFCFNLYDLDGGGTLDTGEMKEMIMAILGAKVDHDGKKATELMSFLKLDDNGEANLKAFKEFARLKGEVLEPCYVLQRRLRARIVGEAFWRSLARKRKAMIKGELTKKEEKIKSLADGARHVEGEDGTAFIRSGDDVEAARVALKAAADAILFKGSETDRALARRKRVDEVRSDMDHTKEEWEAGAEDENEGVGMLLQMEDPGATQRAENKVLNSMNKEYFQALKIGENVEFRDFGVKRSAGGRNRRGRRRRRLSTAVRFKGETPNYLRALGASQYTAQQEQEQVVPQTSYQYDANAQWDESGQNEAYYEEGEGEGEGEEEYA